MASVLRSSTALGFPSFREAAYYVLEELWPSKLSAYCRDDTNEYAADTIILAKQYDVPGVLKRAYYELLRSAQFEQYDGETLLSAEELRLLLKTRKHLCDTWACLTSFPYIWDVCQTSRKVDKLACPAPSRRKTSWYKLVHESGLAWNWVLDPIGGLDALQNADWKTEKMCDECLEKIKSEWAEQKENVWNQLDEWLELDGDQEVSILVDSAV